MARKYKPFITGDLIDLCAPSEQALTDGWSDWFNDAETTRFLSQGVFPNSLEQQRAFYEGLRSGDRLALLICDKQGAALWGIISLSSINWVARSAQIALVLPPDRSRAPLAALEAMALMTQHGFETMGLDRIWAGQAYPGLAKWNQRLETLGYRTEGVLRRGFTKGRFVNDSVMISVLAEDYKRIKSRRPYWPGTEQMMKLLKGLPRVPLSERLAERIAEERAAYDVEVDAVENAIFGAR